MLNQLIITIIRPLQEREEQTLNQEVQLQQRYETINTLVLVLKVVIEQSNHALPADSTASNPVSLALTIYDSVADNLRQQKNLQDRPSQGTNPGNQGFRSEHYRSSRKEPNLFSDNRKLSPFPGRGV
ncbi:hypothetical protein N7522_005651 [Penicillium canescens]|nr:hypothetical protein N7522_005651 [Penicillium canescens]